MFAEILMFRSGWAVLALVVSFATVNADGVPDGSWRFSSMGSAATEFPRCVISLKSKDGKVTASTTDAPMIRERPGAEPRAMKVEVKEVEVKGSTFRMVISFEGDASTFTGTINPKEEKVIRGGLEAGKRISRAVLAQQEGEKLAPIPASARPTVPEPYQTLNRLQANLNQAALKARAAKDANDKADLEAKIKELRAEIDEKAPGLLRETVEKFADNPYAVDAASTLLRTASKAKATGSEIATWTKLIDGDAAKYGELYVRESNVQIAESLGGQKGLEALAVPFATKALGMTNDKSPLELRSRVLWALYGAQLAAKKDQEAKATKQILDKVDGELDAAYLKTVPPFPVTKFEGRKDKSANRVAVLELFTGAQCPPCVAADVAFDAIEKAYSNKDVVLLQYHMHIPGPDPLTNLDTIARWDFYAKQYPNFVTGTPSMLLNGGTGPRVGGGMPNAKAAFETLKKAIDPLLEAKTEVTLSGDAKLTGNKLNINVSASGIAEPGENTRLVVVVVEETVKYTGSNGIRFHHQIVRALPGTAKGVALTEKSSKKSMTVDLAEVKSELNKYLDKYAQDRPFPKADRPMLMEHLKVVVMVQNLETREVLQAAELDVSGKPKAE